MNIFWLSLILAQNALYHCDSYTVKMVVEYTQLLYTWCHSQSIFEMEKYKNMLSDLKIKPFRPTHKSHPCNLWLQESIENVCLLLDLAFAVADEYTRRYHKIHACVRHLELLEKVVGIVKKTNTYQSQSTKKTVPFLAMPLAISCRYGYPEFVLQNNSVYIVMRANSWFDAVEAYRTYVSTKRDFIRKNKSMEMNGKEKIEKIEWMKKTEIPSDPDIEKWESRVRKELKTTVKKYPNEIEKRLEKMIKEYNEI